MPCSRSALAALALGVVGSACAPPAYLRPPSALLDPARAVEIGGGLVNVSKRPYVDEDSQDIGQAWVTARAARWLLVSAVSAFDDEGALGGIAGQARFAPTKWLVFGGGLEAGYAWAGASLAGAGRVVDGLWIYAAPRVSNWGDSPAFGLPMGLSFDVVSGLFLRAEVQVSWADLQYYNRRVHTALAAGWAF